VSWTPREARGFRRRRDLCRLEHAAQRVMRLSLEGDERYLLARHGRQSGASTSLRPPRRGSPSTVRAASCAADPARPPARARRREPAAGAVRGVTSRRLTRGLFRPRRRYRHRPGPAVNGELAGALVARELRRHRPPALRDHHAGRRARRRWRSHALGVDALGARRRLSRAGIGSSCTGSPRPRRTRITAFIPVQDGARARSTCLYRQATRPRLRACNLPCSRAGSRLGHCATRGAAPSACRACCAPCRAGACATTPASNLELA